MTKNIFTAAFIALTAVSLASAQVRVEQTAGGPAGFVVNDIIIDAPAGNGIGALQILMDLTEGSIFQFTTVPSDVRPSAGIVGAFPDAEFDTFVAAGQAIDGATPLVFGASDMLGGPGGGADLAGTSRLDATFSPAAGQPTTGAMNFMAARVTLSEDAAGSLDFLADFIGVDGETVDTFQISNGIVGGTTPIDPIAVGDPAGGSTIDMTMALADLDGLLDDAIMLMNDGGGDLEITGLTVGGANLENFGAVVDDTNPLKIDLSIFGVPSGLPTGTVYTGTLLVETNGGNLSYDLTARVPEPASLALAGLAMIGLVGFRRRK